MDEKVAKLLTRSTDYIEAVTLLKDDALESSKEVEKIIGDKQYAAYLKDVAKILAECALNLIHLPPPQAFGPDAQGHDRRLGIPPAPPKGDECPPNDSNS